jgi:hypothetical protein
MGTWCCDLARMGALHAALGVCLVLLHGATNPAANLVQAVCSQAASLCPHADV